MNCWLAQWLEIVVLTTAKCSATYPLKIIDAGFFGSNTASTEIQAATVAVALSGILLLGVFDRSAIVADVTCAKQHIERETTRTAADRKLFQLLCIEGPPGIKGTEITLKSGP
jgi:hypothetical protein